MKRSKENPGALPNHDYGLALRTVLVEPVARRAAERKPPFFVESRSWHEPRRPATLRSRKH